MKIKHYAPTLTQEIKTSINPLATYNNLGWHTILKIEMLYHSNDTINKTDQNSG